MNAEDARKAAQNLRPDGCLVKVTGLSALPGFSKK